MSHRTFRSLGIAATAAAALVLSACGGNGNGDDAEEGQAGTENEEGLVELTVGVSPVPHGQILQFINDELAEEAGLSLQIEEFTDYQIPNEALDSGELDANYFQHEPWFDAEVEQHGYDIVHFEGVHIEPFALYSSQYDDVADLPEGATIALNNDPSNQARGLVLLQDAGLITLDSGVDEQSATILDVQDNPQDFTFIEADAAALTRTLDDVDAAVINGNFAMEAGLSPTEDGLLVESGEDNPYANFLAVRSEDEDNEAIATLQELLTSDEVRDYIEENWTDGEVLPAF
ncbi:MetQ/NlpA family ABC transporter substrate-binding protein [Nesterenkonia flava]|uniref:Lipoprotein n=1 Tax=Nesterenkonia flava TaxID=469799 RepID=A0ABU1FT42_9MICC|nr:MetQ/NlpA family ABC transporter substrate-binding protein [Nesterenkonia flava]MDR5711311.1 MetQ/NlpA family ABC transporter substrate-binding protein [Nesterenkonia flava]